MSKILTKLKNIDFIKSTLISHKNKQLSKYLTEKEQEYAQDKEYLEGLIPTGQASGESITINVSARYPFKKFKINGKSEQQAYTGKQLFDYSKALGTTGDIRNATILNTYSNGIELKGNETTSGNYSTSNGWYRPGASTTSVEARASVSEATTLYVSADITLLETITDPNMRIYLYGTNEYANSVNKELALNQKVRISQSFEVEPGSYYPIFTLCSNRVLIENIMISTSSDTIYEPYVGEKESPSPSFPQEIYNVSGDVEIKVENKNLIFSQTRVSSSLYPNGITNRNNFTFKPGTYTMSLNATEAVRVYFGDEDGIGVDYNIINAGYSTLTFTRTKLFSFWIYKSTLTDDMVTNWQLEQGSTATTYEPHEEQLVTFPLAEGQLLHLGDTLEDDGIHQMRKTIVLDGSETIAQTSNTSYSTTILRFDITLSDKKLNTRDTIVDNILCNMFTARKLNYDARTQESIAGHANTKTIIIFIDRSMLSSANVEGFKTWLAQQYANNTPVTLEYETETPIEIEYTTEQQKAYDKIKKLHSYKGKTYITCEANLQPTMEVVYRKDIESMIAANNS